MLMGIRLKAVTLGLVTDVGTTLASVTAVLIFFGVQAGMENMAEEEALRFFENVAQEPRFLRVATVLGLLTTAIGGYVAAKVGKKAPLMNAGCVGAIGAIVGYLYIGEVPPPYGPISVILTAPAALLGGSLAH